MTHPVGLRAPEGVDPQHGAASAAPHRGARGGRGCVGWVRHRARSTRAGPHGMQQTRITPARPAVRALDLHCMHRTPWHTHQTHIACARSTLHVPGPTLCTLDLHHKHWTHRVCIRTQHMHQTLPACTRPTSRAPDIQHMHQTLPTCTRPTSHALDPPCMHQTYICSYSIQTCLPASRVLQELEPLCN